MHTLTDWFRLAFRICLSCTLMIEAFVGLLPHLDVSFMPTVASGFDAFFYHNVAFGVLYFVISVWLLFGIKTNVVAALGGILLILPAMVMPEIAGAPLAIKLALATVFALPLAIFGGGRYAINDRCNWREAF